MIEQVAAVSFTASSSGAENFSIDLGAEGSFKLINAMTFFALNTDATVIWGFSPTPDGLSDVTVVGVNAPGYTNVIDNNELATVIDNQSMTGTIHRYLRFSITQDAGDQFNVYVTYYSFAGFTNPPISILSGSITPNNFALINYATSPHLQVVKSIWISAPMGITTPVQGDVFITQTPAIGSGAYLGTNRLTGSCANAVSGSLSFWIPSTAISAQILNVDGSGGAMTYYVTSVGR